MLAVTATESYLILLIDELEKIHLVQSAIITRIVRSCHRLLNLIIVELLKILALQYSAICNHQDPLTR